MHCRTGNALRPAQQSDSRGSGEAEQGRDFGRRDRGCRPPPSNKRGDVLSPALGVETGIQGFQDQGTTLISTPVFRPQALSTSFRINARENSPGFPHPQEGKQGLMKVVLRAKGCGDERAQPGTHSQCDSELSYLPSSSSELRLKKTLAWHVPVKVYGLLLTSQSGLNWSRRQKREAKGSFQARVALFPSLTLKSLSV